MRYAVTLFTISIFVISWDVPNVVLLCPELRDLSVHMYTRWAYAYAVKPPADAAAGTINAPTNMNPTA